MAEVGSIRVLSRAFSILTYLAQEKKPLGVTKIAQAVSLPKATVYRILDTLEGERAVLNRDGEYELGPVALLLGEGYRRQVGFADAARPHLHHLMKETKETIHLFVYEKGELYYLDKIESPYQVRMHSRIGGKASLTRLSGGKALLAALPRDDLKEVREAIPDEVAAQFEGIRAKGYAVDDEENEKGLRCVGAAILDGSGRPRGAVSISAPVYRFPPELLEKYGSLAVNAAEAISREITSLEDYPCSGGRSAG